MVGEHPALALIIGIGRRMAQQTAHGDHLTLVMKSVGQPIMQDEGLRGRADPALRHTQEILIVVKVAKAVRMF